MIDDARSRYRNDPQFHHVVDVMRYVIYEQHLSPSEMREALMLAVYMEEMDNPHHSRFRAVRFAMSMGGVDPERDDVPRRTPTQTDGADKPAKGAR